MTENYLDEFIDGLLVKSEEAYLMSLEIINKPTINYRTEGFCFFICNAWELLLKAFIIRQSNDINSIYFKDATNRTIGLDECVEKVFTSTTDKIKLNISNVRQLRNTATHSVLPEYDYAFSPLFQRCLTNYNTFFKKHFTEFNLNDKVTAFVSLSNIHTNGDNRLAINPKSALQYEELKSIILENEDINQRITLTSVKSKSDADVTYSLDSEATEAINFVKVPKDVNHMYPHTFAVAVKKTIESIELNLGPNHGFNITSFHGICALKKIKEDEKYCFTFDYGGGVKKYSDEAIEYITYIYTQFPDIREKYRSKR